MDRPLPNGWRRSEEYAVSTQEEFIKKMVRETLERPRPKVVPTTVQAKSTQATLDRDPSLDEAHWNRHLPGGVQAEQTERVITPQEFALSEAARRRARNTIGTQDLLSVSRERRERGIEAFTYSKPAELTPDQIRKVTRLEEIVSTPLEPARETPKKWWKFWKKEDGRTLTDKEWEEYFGGPRGSNPH